MLYVNIQRDMGSHSGSARYQNVPYKSTFTFVYHPNRKEDKIVWHALFQINHGYVSVSLHIQLQRR